MTWRECKLVTLQRMFSSTGNEILPDDTTLPYLQAMPGAANEGLQLLATAGKFLIRHAEIIQPEGSGGIQGTRHGNVMKYQLRGQAPDFYQIRDGQVFLLSEGKYGRTYGYATEGDGVLALDAEKQGVWTVYYNAYPAPVTMLTPDSQELALDPEAAALLPLYMASQLYKDDDIGQAVQLRNEFEAGRELLAAGAVRDARGRETLESVSGWW